MLVGDVYKTWVRVSAHIIAPRPQSPNQPCPTCVCATAEQHDEGEKNRQQEEFAGASEGTSDQERGDRANRRQQGDDVDPVQEL